MSHKQLFFSGVLVLTLTTLRGALAEGPDLPVDLPRSAAAVTLDESQQSALLGLLDGYSTALAAIPVGAPARARSGERAAPERTGGLTATQLRRIAPQMNVSLARQVAPHIERTMREFDITTPARRAAFLAQLAHESGGFVHRVELASGAAYEGRRDLGNTQRGDGKRFKGRGFIQLTGRANYRKAGRSLGVNLERQPAMAARLDMAARVSGWFWNDRKLNRLADSGDFLAVTRRINGGTNGLASRKKYHARAKRALKETSVT